MSDKQKDIWKHIYIKSLLEKTVPLSITEIGSNIKETLEEKIKNNIEGKCIPEGFIKPNSVILRNWSSGIIKPECIEFVVIFECMVTLPVEGQLMECMSKTITKAGIHAEIVDKDVTPVQIFVAKDHHTTDYYFNTIKENMQIKVKVIGVRFELNDPYICIIAKLIDPEKELKNAEKKMKIKKKVFNK